MARIILLSLGYLLGILGFGFTWALISKEHQKKLVALGYILVLAVIVLSHYETLTVHWLFDLLRCFAFGFIFNRVLHARIITIS